METVGTFEAKTHLSDLLDRVQRGEEITITRHGKPIARLVPADSSPVDWQQQKEQALDQMKEFRKRHKLKGLSIRELIDEGRRC